ncbi:hypothetical protein GSI_07355 [Ganoderma sinense ZZ0214-1]|uniref:Uncharacterized protein n=1 Tax=Ganoderma sinense ZZ0214-1 TaxID=1077348 RepID=A0A2G8SA71_9APHY|nr:hypothetical protein GSI_07355 [Ganoderma sinense ZZ0214-1]
MLSRKALPKLSTVTCPHVMVERFGDVTLKHLKVEWWDREKDNFWMPVIVLGERGGLYLEPYSGTLETLEYALASYYSRPEQSLELPYLKYLFISSGISDVSHILSWLSIPQTTTIHIAAFDYSFNRDSSARVRSLVSAIGRVHLRLLPCQDQGLETYFVECRAGDGPFSVAESASPDAESRDRAVDLRAFLHLVHLDGCQLHMETLARMLQPNAQSGCVEGETGQAAALACPSLANLVVDIRCAFVHRSAAASGSGGRATHVHESSSSLCRPDTVAGIDGLFRQQCAVLQRLLAARASSRSRLKSLDLRLRPSKVSDFGFRETVDGVPVDSRTSVVWPTRAAMKSVMKSLQEVVDGPMVFKLGRPNGWRDVYP